jgi:hypothetical protein
MLCFAAVWLVLRREVLDNMLRPRWLPIAEVLNRTPIFDFNKIMMANAYVYWIG